MSYEPQVKYCEPEQIEKILEATNSIRDKALLALVYQCGLRRSEVQLLSRNDYFPSRGMLRVLRRKKRETYWHEMVLWGRTKKLLNDYLKTRLDHFDALFLNESKLAGQPVGPQAVYYIFRDAAERAGVQPQGKKDGRGNRHLAPHVLRHSIAVGMMNCGIPVEVIMEHLAHAKLETTLIYARCLTPVKKRAAMMMESSHSFANF